ncbi:CxxxxCH/CxxCH domain-containing protein [candidate division KSB1 bacterium]
MDKFDIVRLFYFAFACVLMISACSEINGDSQFIPDVNVSEDNTVQALSALDMQCSSCHSGLEPAGSYDLSSLLGVYGSGTDEVPNAIPGNSNSLLLRSIRQNGSMSSYIGSSANADILNDWIVDNKLGLRELFAHPSGWQDPSDDEIFHGVYLRNSNWDLSSCQSCHGENYDTEINDKSCITCHEGSPEACNTCHGRSYRSSGAPPADVNGNVATNVRGTGAHETHLEGGIYSTPLECSECHQVPESFSDTGHIDNTSYAELNWGTLATTGGTSPEFTQDLTCKNTYCHGSFATGLKTFEPKWTRVNKGEAACGMCHTLIPDEPSRNLGFVHTFSNFKCYTCHGAVIDENYQIIDKSKHINGVVDVSESK